MNQTESEMDEIETSSTRTSRLIIFYAIMCRNKIKTMKALDIGCGKHPYNIFNASELHGIDLHDPEKDPQFFIRNWQNIKLEQKLESYKRCDLAIENIPHTDYCFDVVTAIDVIEHIPRVIYCPQQRFAFVELMNEIWRVLKPGGLFFACTPFYPHPEAFSDPTHVNYVTANTFQEYFSEPGQYGFKGKFEVRRVDEAGCKLHTQLIKQV
jgi:SAM-dependent methyltransferase